MRCYHRWVRPDGLLLQQKGLLRRCRNGGLARSCSLMPESICQNRRFSVRTEPTSSLERPCLVGFLHQQQRWLATSRQKKAAAAAAAKAESNQENGDDKDAPDDNVAANTMAGSTQVTQTVAASPLLHVTNPETAGGSSTGKTSNTNNWEQFTAKQLKTNALKTGSDFLPHKDIFRPEVHLATAPTDWSGYEEATPLWEDLAAKIGVTGKPISVAEYMRECLTHPEFGYYTVGKTIGAAPPVDEFDKEEWDDEKEESDKDLVIGGDFVTAPEMSQMFGETLGVWIAMAGQQQGLMGDSRSRFKTLRKTTDGNKWQYVEAGPGKGTLLVDLMRSWRSLSKGKTVGKDIIPTAVHLLEASPKMRAVQMERLEKETDLLEAYDLTFVDCTTAPSVTVSKPMAPAATDKGTEASEGSEDDGESGKAAVAIHWHSGLDAFELWQKQHGSYLPTFCICQEFMDALPIHAFEKTKEGWRERLVDIALREDIQKREEEHFGMEAAAGTKTSTEEKLRLRIVHAPEVTPAAKILLRLTDDNLMPTEVEMGTEAPVGSVVEVSAEAVLMTQDLARIVERQGGGALIIDYGQEGSRDTIRAFSRHQQMHFLAKPGQVDITADVDFAALKHAVNTLKERQTAASEKGDSRKDENSDSSATDDDDHTKDAPLPPARAYGPIQQGPFLMSMGIKERALQLAETEDVTEEQIGAIYQALVRLCTEEEMGARFKVLAIVPYNANDDGIEWPPPGF